MVLFNAAKVAQGVLSTTVEIWTGVRSLRKKLKEFWPSVIEMEGSTIVDPSKVSVLVVDDERNIRNNLTTVLQSAGYKVDASGDGEDALTKCKERHYDIALVDIQMPKMGGLQLLRYLRTLRPNLAVVILTAYGTVGSAVEAMKLGAVDFLEKPFDPKVLLLLCEEIIQRQKTATKGSAGRSARCSPACLLVTSAAPPPFK